MTEKHSPARARGRIAVLITALLLLASSWGAWEWGRQQELWGASDEVYRLLDQELISSAEDGVSVRIVGRSPHRGILGKSKPLWVEAELAPSPSSPMSAEELSEGLRDRADAQGWAIDEECAPELLWCARRMDDSGRTLFMTVSAAQESEPITSERMSGESHRVDIVSGALRVRMQYL